MLNAILLIILGIYIGWNFAMPEVIRNFQNKVIGVFKKS